MRFTIEKFLKDEQGHLAMEFILWMFFVLMPWFIVSAVLYDSYRNLDLATKASYTLADLISRQTVLRDESTDSPDLADIIVLQRALMPRTGRDMSLRISSIKCVRVGGCFDDGSEDYERKVENYEVSWSVVPTRAEWLDEFVAPVPLQTGADEDTEAGVPIHMIPRMAELDTVLLIDMTVTHIPISRMLEAFTDFTWEFRVPIRPRFVPEIELVTSEDNVFFQPEG